MSVIAVDGMGGDDAPGVVVEGAIEAAREGIHVALVGDEAVLQQHIVRIAPQGAPPTLRVVHAGDVIEMGDHAALEARTRRDSSIYVGLRLVKQGEADAFVSAGNTGAVFALSLLLLGRIKGIERPALGGVFPLPTGPVLVLDVGANAEVRPSHLVQFARVGIAYMRELFGIADPSVGLLNIGEEDIKGNEVVKQAAGLLRASGLNFCGNVEGDDIYKGTADVVVCDGFVGNVALKTSEGLAQMLATYLREEFGRNLLTRIGALVAMPVLRAFKRRVDHRRYNGASLLGLRGIVIKSHGSADAFAYGFAIEHAVNEVRTGVLSHISERMAAQERKTAAA